MRNSVKTGKTLESLVEHIEKALANKEHVKVQVLPS
jgi:hypothetical protein